jgi:CBS domain-containing protein
MTFLARDLMQSDPIVVSSDASLLAVHRLFTEEEIHGAPVVDDDGTLVGVISTLDLLRATLDERDAEPSIPAYFRDQSDAEWSQAPADYADRLALMTAIDVAIPDLVAVEPDTPIADVARIMRDQRVHRVLVVEDGVLLGILTTFDLLRLVENGALENQLEIEHRVH